MVRFLLQRQRDSNDELGSFAFAAAHLNGAMVGLDDPIGYGQAQAGSLANIFSRKERLEDAMPDALPDASSGVPHGDQKHPVLGSGRNGDFPLALDRKR